MNTELIVSILGVILSAILSLNLVNWRLNKIEEQLKENNAKLEKHNSYAEKFAELSGDIKAITLEIKHIKELKEREVS